MEYFDKSMVHFSTGGYTTRFQKLEKGIAMGCAISPVLFVMVMEVLLRGVNSGVTVRQEGGSLVPRIRAFMDDLTIIEDDRAKVEHMLERLTKLVQWSRMEFKVKKSRSASLTKGKVTWERFNIAGEEIPTIREEGVKS